MSSIAKALWEPPYQNLSMTMWIMGCYYYFLRYPNTAFCKKTLHFIEVDITQCQPAARLRQMHAFGFIWGFVLNCIHLIMTTITGDQGGLMSLK